MNLSPLDFTKTKVINRSRYLELMTKKLTLLGVIVWDEGDKPPQPE